MNLKEIYDISKNYGIEIYQSDLILKNHHIGYIMHIENNDYVVQLFQFVLLCDTIENLQARLADIVLDTKIQILYNKLQRIKEDFV